MFNESLHELQYENIFVYDKIVKTLIDSGANIVCVKSSLIPPETKSFGTVQLTCAFGNEIQAQLTKIKLALQSFRENPIIVTAAICNKLYCDLIVPRIIPATVQGQMTQLNFKTLTTRATKKTQ
ncbi:hypothetical protein NPIL_649211 [Nephila pilipes]|uniref:Uncharacterized protein n=1 Tax=Nephila pilipes TaxID=299642 RepID=A0A8X6NQU0_NEPPI|nr:hypothetical protein NPIL_649211 [Nephila pilipes]